MSEHGTSEVSTMAEPGGTGAHEGPVVLIGYAGGVLPSLGKFLPDGSVIFVEEPDVVRKRDVRSLAAGSPTLREVIEWEYQLDGAADAFYLAHPDLRPSAVMPISEYGVPFAARIAERYGVLGTGYGAALALRDKALLRTITAAAGIPNPRSVEVSSPAEVRALMAELGTVVLKPANRQGALGTRILSDPADVDAAWAACTQQDEGVFVPDRGLPLRMLVERYLRGDEYSVEMWFHEGEPRFAAPTRKYLFDGPTPVEQGHLHPADVSPELYRRLIDDTTRVLTAIGMGSGFVHCEWIVEDGVPYLVECAGRMAGDGIIELVMMAWQHDIVEQFYTAMRGGGLGTAPPAPDRWAAAWMAHAPAGEVESVDGVEEAKAVPGVHTCVATVGVGAQVHELRSSWDRVAMVTAEGATADEALGNARQAIDHIVVKVRPTDPS
ncbi:MAG TPA: ATP-grasp domain-containing protein [Pseudonocardiaceae bacterium]